MTDIHGQLNRPVHLARRDAFFQRTVELINLPLQQADTQTRLSVALSALDCLQEAREHAFYASRSPGRSEREVDFLQFLDLVIENVDSLAAMFRHQTHLEEERGFLQSFLGTSREETSVPAFHYQRRAEDILQGLWHLLRLAQTPYSALRQVAVDTLNPQEQGRYELAYQHFQGEAKEKFATPEFRAENPVSQPGV